MVVALLAPGQGAQKPGFLEPWLALPNAEARLREWSSLCGSDSSHPLDLVHLGQTASADEIKDTAKTQPLLVAAALLAAEQLPLEDVTIVAGHSVGELAAAALAGVMSAEDAVAFAATRGAAMAAACAHEPTGMSAVLGGDTQEVLDRIAACNLTAANRNGAGQIVAAGSRAGLDQLAAEPPAKARVIPLRVAGAFHTDFMIPAEAELAAVSAGIAPEEPRKLLLSNADGVAVGSGRDVMDRLVAQVTKSVRWDLCQQTLLDLGVTAIIELPPAGTLTGLAKREFKGRADIEVVTINTPGDLTAARDVLKRHGVHPGSEPAVQFQLAVTASAGIFMRHHFTEGDALTARTEIGHVQTRQGDIPVTTAHAGVFTEWLADDGDPISLGQPVARLYPVGNNSQHATQKDSTLSDPASPSPSTDSSARNEVTPA